MPCSERCGAIKMSECYVFNIALYVLGFLFFVFFLVKANQIPSSVSSVENDKHLLIWEIYGPQLENPFEVLTFFFLQTAFSIKETLSLLIFWSELETKFLPSFSVSTLSHVFAGSLTPVWGSPAPIPCGCIAGWRSHGTLPGAMSLQIQPLGCSCLRSLAPRIRPKLPDGPRRSLASQGFHPPPPSWRPVSGGAGLLLMCIEAPSLQSSEASNNHINYILNHCIAFCKIISENAISTKE